MAVLFVFFSWDKALTTGIPALFLVAALGSIVAIVRGAMQLARRPTFVRPDLNEVAARHAEQLFAAAYLAFAMAIGTFAFVALLYSAAGDQIGVAALVVGFAAGVVAGVSLRPLIGIPAVLLAVVPTIAAALLHGSRAHIDLAVLLSVLLLGGIRSMIVRYRGAVEKIEMRQLLASMARQDPLTALATRFALDDAFLSAVRQCGGKQVVLHCLDLDRFKPVNDLYGHGVGDQLLQAVAGRLARVVRTGDLPVRLGGDEFAVLQTNVEHRDEANLMARRIARALSEPYVIEGHDIRIGVSVGSASGADHGPILSQLLAVADKALYEVKHGAGSRRAVARG
jgi:diguanylate cyclase (GGDEF)-like protein